MRSTDLLKRARRDSGLSVQDVAGALGVKPRTVYRFEAGGGIRSAIVFRIPLAYRMSYWNACIWFWRGVQEERYRFERRQRGIAARVKRSESLEEVSHERT